MTYKELGLVNTKTMLNNAMAGRYAVPAFNIFNMETLGAVLAAARKTHSPVILAVSESALKYMTPEMLIGMIRGANIKPAEQIALHLDHGATADICIAAINMGFSSVMIDGAHLPLNKNIELTKSVTEYAHQNLVTVEAELGTISGIEDENTRSTISSYTKTTDVVRFVAETHCDSLAIAIGTSHGAYKRHSTDAELRFDILAEIGRLLPDFPLVLHGASSIPTNLVNIINENGGKIPDANGIPTEQLKRAVEMNICKINVDSDSRLAFTAGVRCALASHPDNINPREYLTAGRDMITQNCIDEIENIMKSANQI